MLPDTGRAQVLKAGKLAEGGGDRASQTVVKPPASTQGRAQEGARGMAQASTHSDPHGGARSAGPSPCRRQRLLTRVSLHSQNVEASHIADLGRDVATQRV
jgi:hypothetical protein